MTTDQPTTASRAHLDAVRHLLTYGFRAVTSADLYRGARQMWVDTPAGMAGPHAEIRVGSSGRMTSARLFPYGEAGPVRTVSGESAVYAAVCDLTLAALSGRTPAEAIAEREAVLRSIGRPTAV